MARKPKGASGPPTTPPPSKDATTGRFQSRLTPELVDKLCSTHSEGCDYRNVTAARCAVHPKTLSAWLKLGASNEAAGLATDLFMRLTKIEGDIRAKWLAEIADVTASVEHTEFEDGKPVSRTVNARRTSGLQWLMERRFRQFRMDHAVTADEEDALSLLQPQAQAMTPEMAIAMCQMLAQNPERLPEPIRILFAATDWRAPKKLPHGEETAH